MASFLLMLTKEEHIRALQDKDVPHLIGNSVDELIRHHPSLKDETMAAIIKMLERVAEIGNEVPADEAELRTLHVQGAEGDSAEKSTKEKKEARITMFIDIVCRFMEGFFQNSAHCKDFIKSKGVDILVQFYYLPSLPLDFATSPSSFSLSYLFRLLVETNSYSISTPIIKSFYGIIEKMKPFLENSGESFVQKYIDLKGRKWWITGGGE
ncbi:hypothetical protein HDU67_005602 [Dinochytrium kinnereticum]|nr:hypothetical protein HDU67_005602 [Dinochytrium kinnereticum]